MSNKFTVKYKEFALSIQLDEKNIHIKDSYKIIDNTIIATLLNKIIQKANEEGYFYKRSIKSFTNEWKAYNWLYEHKIHIDRTASVDLNDDEKLLNRLGYWFISNFWY